MVRVGPLSFFVGLGCAPCVIQSRNTRAQAYLGDFDATKVRTQETLAGD